MMLQKIHVQNLIPGDCIYEKTRSSGQLVWFVLSKTEKYHCVILQFARFSKHATTIFSDAEYRCDETFSCDILLAPRNQK